MLNLSRSRVTMNCGVCNHNIKFLFSTNRYSKQPIMKDDSFDDSGELSPLKSRVDCLDRQNFRADFSMFAYLLRECCRYGALKLGRRVHDHIVRCGMDGHKYLSNQIVNMYGICGSVQEAHQVFDKIQGKNVFSWNAIIGAYTRQGRIKEAFELSQRMEDEGLRPDKITFLIILNSCASHATMVEGKLIHLKILNSEFDSDVSVNNALMNMYIKLVDPQQACRIFNGMSERNTKSWNLVIAAYAKDGHVKQALQRLSEMQLCDVEPDRISFLNILNAISCPGNLAEGKQLHSLVAAIGLESDVVVATALVSMYGRCGSLEDARMLFDTMHVRNVVSWTTMIGAYTQKGHGNIALEIYKQMQQKGVTPNEITFLTALDACGSIADLHKGKFVHRNIIDHGFQSHIILGNAVINMYSRCGNLKEAENVFSQMTKKDVISWNTMISACTLHGQNNAAIRLFHLMQQEGFNPNKVTFVCLSEAISSLKNLAETKSLHCFIKDSTYALDLTVGNAVLNMFCKCGSMKDAHKTFSNMPKRDIISWSTLILAHIEQGHDMVALQLFDDMQHEGLQPNKVVLVGVFNACANLSNLSKGKVIHRSFVGDTVELDLGLGNAIISMYGKCGDLENARSMFEKMLERNSVTWSTIVSAYAQHGHGKVALQLFGKMQVLGEKVDKICSISVLSACSNAGLVDEGSHYFESLTATTENSVVDVLGCA